jgi:hypothetical protein
LENRWNDHWKAKAKATAAPSPAQLPQLPSPSAAATAAVHFAAVTKEAEAVHYILGH